MVAVFAVFCLFSLGLLFIVYLLLKNFIGKRLQSKALLEPLRQGVDEIIVELNRATDRNISLIEERIRVLTELLERADKELLLLKKQLVKNQQSQQTYTHLGRFEATSPPGGREEERKEKRPQPQDPTTGKKEVLRLHRQGVSPALIAGRCQLSLGEVELILSLATTEDLSSSQKG